jgi:hypothetical protein
VTVSELKFIVRGQVVGEYGVKAHLDKAKPRVSDGLKKVESRYDAKVSQGFVVLGYSPTHWEKRVADRLEALRLHEMDSKNKAPGTLEEWTAKWMAKNKPKKVRSKPYELESAADECGQLAVRAGWLYVRIEEILKG